VSEALTNAAKYARASVVLVDVEQRNSMLHVIVQDDGPRRGRRRRGSGLIDSKTEAEGDRGTISLLSREGRNVAARRAAARRST